MLNKIINILNEYISNYAIVPSDDNTSNIIFFIPYNPYEEYNNKSIFIDAYYKASNDLYHKTKEIINKLQEIGIDATREKRHILKDLAIISGLARPTKTSLVANAKYGTRIVLGSIVIKGYYKQIRDVLDNDLCLSCGKCSKACPTKALTNKGFNKELCIRYLQEEGNFENNELASLFSNKVWGCDECQKACPLNSHLQQEKIQAELKEFLDIDNFIKKALYGKKALMSLVPFLGYNYIKPRKLLALALNAAINQEDYRALEYKDDLYRIDNHEIRLNLNRLISKYNKR